MMGTLPDVRGVPRGQGGVVDVAQLLDERVGEALQRDRFDVIRATRFMRGKIGKGLSDSFV